MSSTKKKLFFVILISLVFSLLGVVYVVISNVKKPLPATLAPEIVLQNLIPGQSTKEDVISLRGKPSITTSSSDLELLNYEIKEIEETDIYAFSDNTLSFYMENRIKPDSFTSFSKTRGVGKTYYEEGDDFFIWHIYSTKGIGVATIGKDIVRYLIFMPMTESEFNEKVGGFLGLSTKMPEEEPELIPELE